MTVAVPTLYVSLETAHYRDVLKIVINRFYLKQLSQEWRCSSTTLHFFVLTFDISLFCNLGYVEYNVHAIFVGIPDVCANHPDSHFTLSMNSHPPSSVNNTRGSMYRIFPDYNVYVSQTDGK